MHGRFGHLRASGTLPRLQLAALYAATGSLLPEPGSRCTGGQTAMALIRQCWGNAPLTVEESKQLSTVGVLGGYLAPSLRLLVHELHTSSRQLSHLHAANDESLTGSLAMPQLEPDAQTSYSQSMHQGTSSGFPNLRMQLTHSEERRVLGTSTCDLTYEPDWLRQGHYAKIELAACPVSASVVADIEAKLVKCVMASPCPSPHHLPPYLLDPNRAPVQASLKRARDGGLSPLAVRVRQGLSLPLQRLAFLQRLQLLVLRVLLRVGQLGL